MLIRCWYADCLTFFVQRSFVEKKRLWRLVAPEDRAEAVRLNLDAVPIVGKPWFWSSEKGDIVVPERGREFERTLLPEVMCIRYRRVPAAYWLGLVNPFELDATDRDLIRRRCGSAAWSQIYGDEAYEEQMWDEEIRRCYGQLLI